MILAAAFALGFALGWWRAAARGGNRLDRLQYGAAHGIALALAALALVLILERLAG
ncbi:MAG: hypothetical protein KatS3mg118_0757 [Paracoccaceae bacterium]|nr:MAG: hypothetical protein KatS3mg118_0757 [Paracoccaceae bacterium]